MMLYNIWQSRVNGNYVKSDGNTYADIQLNTLSFTTGTTSIGATVSVTFARPKEPISEYMVTMVNNSTVTDITCNIYNVIAVSTNSTGCNSLVGSLSFPKEKTYSQTIHGIFLSTSTIFSFSNDSTTTNAQAFTNYFTLQEVY